MAEKLSIDVLARAVGLKSLVDLKSGFDMIYGVAMKIGAVFKDVTTEYAIQEKENAQLNAVLKSTGYAAGLSSKEIINMAESFVKLTTFSRDSIEQAQNLLLTFTNIKSNIFPQATETVLNMATALGSDAKGAAIQLGKALQDPIMGVAALRRVGVNFNKVQMDMIKTLVESGNSLEAQKIILKELETEFGGSAKAVAETFGGSLQQLTNLQNETKEAVGQMISIIAKDFVKAMIEGTIKLNEFLNSQQVLDTVAAGTKVVWGGLTDIFDAFGNVYETMSEKVGTGLGKFSALDVVFKGLSVAFLIVTKAIAVQIEFWAGIIDVAKNAGKVLKDVWDIMTGSKEKKKAAWADLSKVASESFDDLRERAQSFGEDFVKDIGSIFKKLPGTIKPGTDEVENEYLSMLDRMGDGTKDKTKEQKKTWDQYLSDIYSKGSEVFGNIQSLVSQTFDNMTETMKDNLDKQLENIDENTQAQLEMMGLADETKSEMIQKEIEEKIGQLGTETDEEDRSAIRDEIRELELEKKKADILEKAEAKKQKLRESYAKKEHALKVQQFRAGQALQIAQVWIQAGMGIAGAWAQSFTAAPPPAAAIMAAIGTALMLTNAGIATGIIASQAPPALATGGDITKSGMAMVGEKGPEMAFFPAGTRVLPNEAMSGFGSITINNLYVQANSAEQLVSELQNLKHYEMGRG